MATNKELTHINKATQARVAGGQTDSRVAQFDNAANSTTTGASTPAARPDDNHRATSRYPQKNGKPDVGDSMPNMEPNLHTLERASEEGDLATFRHELQFMEEPLRDRVGRWIQRYPELDAQNNQSFEISDLVEAVFLEAFEAYPRKPRELTLPEWFESLIDPALKGFARNEDDRLAVGFEKTLTDNPSKSFPPETGAEA